MNYQHKDLANGKWKQLSLLQQMANIGSEVERAINWNEKGNREFARLAAGRALELFDLTLDAQEKYARKMEIARTRELFADFFYGDNEYKSTKSEWQKYFFYFTYAVALQK